jgi:hypothetical protein
MGDNTLRIGKSHDAPHYSLRIGYFFTSPSGLGIELNFDHTKYTLKQGQRIRLRGTINGYEYNQDTIISADFIEYEHTDGANYLMLNLLKRIALCHTGAKKRVLDLVLKAGAGPVIPKTNSRIMGFHRDDKYHVSGFVAGLESSLRYEFLKNLYGEFSLKGAYADYSDVLIFGDGRARQRWWSGQYIFSIAYQLPAGKKN